MGDVRRVRLLCAASFIVGASLTLLALSGVTFWYTHHYRSQVLSHLLAGDRAYRETAGSEITGPWGRIEAMQIPLANTEGAFPDETERLRPTRWFFENFSENKLTRFFSACDLRPAEHRVLLDKRQWQIASNGIMVCPSEQLLWALTHRAREQIYNALSRSPTNYA